MEWGINTKVCENLPAAATGRRQVVADNPLIFQAMTQSIEFIAQFERRRKRQGETALPL